MGILSVHFHPQSEGGEAKAGLAASRWRCSRKSPFSAGKVWQLLSPHKHFLGAYFYRTRGVLFGATVDTNLPSPTFSSYSGSWARNLACGPPVCGPPACSPAADTSRWVASTPRWTEEVPRFLSLLCISQQRKCPKFWSLLRQDGRRLRVRTSRRGGTQIFWASTRHNPSRADTFCLRHHLGRLAETGKSLLVFFRAIIFTPLASSPFQIERSFCSVLPSSLQAIIFPSPSNAKLNLSQKKTPLHLGTPDLASCRGW